ncbi:MAG: multicopper oxidase domain-containing protein, partial [Actinomycetia bacterium]|nr:multicopper oxidase domain-containing protein [Actinomycetes bacterium]
MSDQPRRVSRRQALQLSMGGVLAGGGIIAQRRLGGGGGSVETVSPAAPGPLPLIGGAAESVRSIATDGYMSYPGRRVRQPTTAWDGTDGYGYDSDRLDAGDGVYSFGFRTIYDHEVDGPSAFDAPIGELVGKFKGLVHHPSSILGFSKNADVFINMSNLGFEVRPDLDDAHTLHWHGFRQAVTVWDGVPEVSVSVPPTRDFPYYFGALDEGTYMYHCHFEDVEHVQMGMDGILYVNPVAGADHLYEDGPTQFDRQYGLLLNEVDLNPHDLLASVQEFTWSDYDAHYFVINGRSYPDTVRGSGDPGLTTSPWYDTGSTLPLQPVSSLIQANQGDRVAIRLANL